MNIGSLKHRITIEAPTKVPDNMGGVTVTWSERDTIWCAIWPTSAKERIQQMGVTMTISSRIRIRYRSDIRSSWRLKFKNQYFDIVSLVNPNMENKILDLMVKEAA